MMINFAAALAVLLTQTIELSIVSKVTLVLGAGLLAVRLATRARASVRHVILVTTFAVVFALPPAAMLSPTVPVVAIGPSSRSASAGSPWAGRKHTPLDRFLPFPDAGTAATGAATSAIEWRTALAIGWSAGFILFMVPLVSGIVRLRRIRRTGLPSPSLQALVAARAREVGIRRPVECLVHERVVAPITCGIRRPVLILPVDAAGWSDRDLDRAIVHELEHVRRLDWPVQLAARITAALWWFHPLAWVALRQLCLAAERACDDAVVGVSERTEYADQLVQLARRLVHAPAQPGVAMANRSNLSTRVSALLDVNQRRGRAGGVTIAAASLAAAALLVTVAPLQAVVAPREPEAAQAPAARPGDTPARASRLDRSLYRAAERGDVKRMSELIDQGADVNSAFDGDGSPLIAAARAGHLDAVALLLDRHADPNLGVAGDGSPLIAASASGQATIAALLLDRGAKIEMVVQGDENALIQASGEGRLAVVKLLVSRGANVNAGVWVDRYDNQREWRSPLFVAERGRHTDVVAFLRASGAR